jgi:hypothetical protein
LNIQTIISHELNCDNVMERRVQIDFIKKRFLLLEKCLNDESANEYTVSALMFHDTIFLILCLQNMIGLWRDFGWRSTDQWTLSAGWYFCKGRNKRITEKGFKIFWKLGISQSVHFKFFYFALDFQSLSILRDSTCIFFSKDF